ncbi:hypothetical protein [Micromonospora sp. WMMD737]|uniref:hypothetical protein n=1 Tax=Micromonospora sp. WMMD737 TaxID=3404113 RepID=UPI003B94FB7C
MTPVDAEHPQYGYGRGERPLWSARDRDAETLRKLLRRAGLRDFDERHLDGFAVEGANASQDGPEPFVVTYCGTDDVPEAVARYRAVLERAGYQVEPDPFDERALLVPRQSTPATAVTSAATERRVMAAAVVCAVMATVALLTSWTGSGAVRLAGGVGSAVCGVLAVFLAGLWYRRRAHLD